MIVRKRHKKGQREKMYTEEEVRKICKEEVEHAFAEKEVKESRASDKGYEEDFRRKMSGGVASVLQRMREEEREEKEKEDRLAEVRAKDDGGVEYYALTGRCSVCNRRKCDCAR